MKTEIIYEDSHVLAVYKPGGLATQTARAGEQDVVSELKNYLYQTRGGLAAGSQGQEPYLGVVHRLDQPVEGLLVFAKDRKAAADLTAQMQKTQREVLFHKCYYAVAWGLPPAPEGELVDYLLKDREGRALIAQESAGAKKAVLRYRILGTRPWEEACSRPGAALGREHDSAMEGERPPLETPPARKAAVLADIRLLTGRFHQIRVQMAHAGLPLLGDRKYGSQESRAFSDRAGVRNVALCAYSLEFRHPVQGRPMHFRIEPRGPVFRELFGNIFS